jgi:transcriptional regulator with XRE-family HTH domain
MMKLGFRIKSSRMQQRLTLKDLAEKTGFSASFISQLERGRLSPSMRSLEKIACALNTDVCYFLEGAKDHEIVLMRKGSRKKVIVKEKKISVEILASGIFGIKMQPQVFTLGISSELSKDSICTTKEIFGMVLKGRLEFCWNKEKLILAKGDSIYLAHTGKLYGITNIGRGDAKLLWISLSS